MRSPVLFQTILSEGVTDRSSESNRTEALLFEPRQPHVVLEDNQEAESAPILCFEESTMSVSEKDVFEDSSTTLEAIPKSVEAGVVTQPVALGPAVSLDVGVRELSAAQTGTEEMRRASFGDILEELFTRNEDDERVLIRTLPASCGGFRRLRH
jgi:hypothetical protein